MQTSRSHGSTKPIDRSYREQVTSERRHERTYLEVRELVHSLNARESVDLDPWEHVNVSDAVFAASRTSEPVTAVETNIDYSIKTFGLVGVACMQ